MGRYNRISAKCYLRPISLSLLLTGLATTGATSAAILTVNSSADLIASDGFCTLREAIINANNNDQSGSADCPSGEASPDDIIKFDASTDNNPIVLTLTGTDENAAATGDLDITDSLMISGNGADSVTEVDGNATDRVFEVRNDAQVYMERIAITNGGGVTVGAGIRLFSGRLDMQDAGVFSNNIIDGPGPGVLQGAGIATSDVLRLLRVSVTGNEIQASGALNGYGAGISVTTNGSVGLENSLVKGNIVETENGTAAGAGLYNNPANVAINTKISSTLFSGNQAIATGDGGAAGGAINHQSGDMGIVRGMFRNNVVRKTAATDSSPANGGAIQAFDPVVIRNSTFSGNRAESVDSSTGGALALNDTGSLNNVTITDNRVQASSGANAVAGGLRGNSSVSISNTLIAGNTTNDDGPDCNGTITSAGYNLIGNNSGCGFSEFTGDLVGDVAGGAPAINPLLASLADNGGSITIDGQTVTVLTHALQEGSPAIDAGDPNAPGSGGTCESLDQPGMGRPIDGDSDGGAVCDIGAVEFTGESTGSFGGGSGGGGGGAMSPLLLLFAGLMVLVATPRRNRVYT